MTNFSAWADASLKITDELIPIFERYLLHSLATGASSMGQSCIDALSLCNSAIAMGYLKRLEAIGLKCSFVGSSSEVDSFVEKLGDKPWEADPFFVCIRSVRTETIQRIHELREYQEVAASAVSKEVGNMVKRRFIEVDSLFRHLRNALAHGRFRVNGTNLFFFDLKQDGKSLSCCALVPLSTLNEWYEVSCNVAKRRL
ncbi:MAG: hypothetical protein SOX20_03990 [Parolsenella sp.]|uniref:hypothetical protein n=1 Tax=Parolsenella sp. TaxID=2083006 RepID=UPI002A758560|nr:hypothetical protein [Parolsenella sp.]MCI5950397.1 hypothetical protein [Coriobacteriaceae bacterium]MDY3292071.1 hypothetical protein [Parolsenella sp.]